MRGTERERKVKDTERESEKKKQREREKDRERQRDRETERQRDRDRDKTTVSRTICTSDTFHDVRLKELLTFHNGFMFFATYFYVIMNHQAHHNIRNGIVWVRTSHSTCTCTHTLHVVEL